jgi:lipoic acid synthetase
MSTLRKPEWLRIDMKKGKSQTSVTDILKNANLNTVCEAANCPNRMECFSNKTATFMVLGNVCTRNCRFCNVDGGSPETLDLDEPRRVAEAVKKLDLKHAVITSVTRDDLDDGGSEHFVNVINAIRKASPGTSVEVLIPDFQGIFQSLKKVVDAKPDVLNHNIETIPRLYASARPEADYIQSLELLSNVKKINSNIKTKSGIMVGLGETFEEVTEVLLDLRKHSCDFLTIGQYLAPSSNHLPVVEYVHPDVFQRYADYALSIGFEKVASAPLVRSSYNANEMLNK